MVSDPADCNLVLNLTGLQPSSPRPATSRARSWRTKGVNYAKVDGPAGEIATVKVGEMAVASYDGAAPSAKTEKARFEKEVRAALDSAGYPAKAAPIEAFSGQWLGLVFILTILRDLRDHGVRPHRGDAGRDVPDAHSLHLDELALTTLVMVGSAAFCQRSRFRSWRPWATSIAAFGTQS